MCQVFQEKQEASGAEKSEQGGNSQGMGPRLRRDGEGAGSRNCRLSLGARWGPLGGFEQNEIFRLVF